MTETVVSDEILGSLTRIEQLLVRVEERVGSEHKRLLTRREAAESLSMSLDSFENHVQGELRLVRKGAMRLVPVDELDRWVRQHQGFAG
jgi:hypothetical protein